MAADGPPAHELDPVLEFLRAIWALNHSVERTSIRMESALGITAQQRFVIRLIGRLPGVTPGALADLLHVDRGSITAVLKRLEARELVRRTPDSGDRRRVSLALTARGRKLNVPTGVSVERAVELALDQSPVADVAAMKRVVRRLIAALDRVSDDADGAQRG
jgi:MarR family transcriptional regulator, organic hydroperoxide resistance regulator